MDYQITCNGRLAGDAEGANLDPERFFADVGAKLAEWCTEAHIEGSFGGDLRAELTVSAASPIDALHRADAILNETMRDYGVDPRAYVEWRQLSATRPLVGAGTTATAGQT